MSKGPQLGRLLLIYHRAQMVAAWMRQASHFCLLSASPAGVGPDSSESWQHSCQGAKSRGSRQQLVFPKIKVNSQEGLLGRGVGCGS